MIVFPNCKINLGLHILRKRADGFHDLETVFYPFQLHDALEMVQQPSPPALLTVSGLQLDATPANNIVLKAYQLLQKEFPSLPAVHIHLHKVIPSGAGLGGGSADGAFALILLNKKFNLGLTDEQLISYALQLGSDCPFFILNKPCLAEGRGEIMTPVPLDLSGYSMILVHPGIHIHTGWAFSKIRPGADRPSLKNIISQPVEEWKGQLKNDFEAPVFEAYPEIAAIKQQLYDHGALYASMSGSGSSVFGIFNTPVPEIEFPENYTVVKV